MWLLGSFAATSGCWGWGTFCVWLGWGSFAIFFCWDEGSLWKWRLFAFSTFSYTIPTSLVNNIFSMPRYFWEASKKAISLHICQVCLPMCSEDGTDAPGGQGNLWTRDNNFSYPVSKRQDTSHDSWPDLCWCSHSLFQKIVAICIYMIYIYIHTSMEYHIGIIVAIAIHGKREWGELETGTSSSSQRLWSWCKHAQFFVAGVISTMRCLWIWGRNTEDLKIFDLEIWFFVEEIKEHVLQRMKASLLS